MSGELQRPEPGDLAMIVGTGFDDMDGRVVFCKQWVREGARLLGRSGNIEVARDNKHMEIEGIERFDVVSARCLIKISPGRRIVREQAWEDLRKAVIETTLQYPRVEDLLPPRGLLPNGGGG